VGNTTQEAGLCQLAYAKACRRAGHHDAAALAVLEVTTHVSWMEMPYKPMGSVS
jgi:cytochrome c-type biogenesis protein CcmH/NrfG